METAEVLAIVGGHVEGLPAKSLVRKNEDEMPAPKKRRCSSRLAGGFAPQVVDSPLDGQ
jgi:hypothetical protein